MPHESLNPHRKKRIHRIEDTPYENKTSPRKKQKKNQQPNQTTARHAIRWKWAYGKVGVERHMQIGLALSNAKIERHPPEDRGVGVSQK